MDMEIDTSFDVYTDTPAGRDPDSHSKTLRRYHQALWSKPLPSGELFMLSTETPKVYLHHASGRGEFFLSSDSIGHTYRHVKAMAHIIQNIPTHEMNSFYSTCSTIGAYTIFPSQKVDGKRSINGARGMHHAIRDRFDLTLECIRRYYIGEVSPLADTLARYKDFFDLFDNFAGYVDFFLFNDLINQQKNEVLFLLPFRGFDTSPLPSTVGEYHAYRASLTSFIKARNRRIASSIGGSQI